MNIFVQFVPECLLLIFNFRRIQKKEWLSYPSCVRNVLDDCCRVKLSIKSKCFIQKNTKLQATKKFTRCRYFFRVNYRQNFFIRWKERWVWVEPRLVMMLLYLLCGGRWIQKRERMEEENDRRKHFKLLELFISSTNFHLHVNWQIFLNFCFTTKLVSSQILVLVCLYSFFSFCLCFKSNIDLFIPFCSSHQSDAKPSYWKLTKVDFSW